MKKNAKRILCTLLVLCMCLTMLPQVITVANATTPTYTVSSAYQSSSYYSSLLEVELTGDQREDIINVALSQVGYREGNYSGDYGGEDDGYYNNYTEYNYWYNNYISSDMPVGGSWAPWCATFVSWCAEQARIPTSILQRSTAAGHGSWYFNVNFYSGSGTLDDYSDADSYFMGYNYTPKRGDLFFTRSWSHVGLVVEANGSYVTTVEGNTNNDGSADGFGVFVRTRRIADLYFGVPEYVESYIGSFCTYYPAHCQIKIDSSTTINSQPCSEGNNDSEILENAYAGATFTAIGMYKNSFGNFWYEVETSSGDTGYIYAGDCSYVKNFDNDISLSSGATAPNGIVEGNIFVVNGTISSEHSGLTEASVYIYSGYGTTGTPVTGDSDTVSGKSYPLVDSTIDYNTSFGSLTAGSYTYAISTKYTNYYATDATTLASVSGTIDLMTEYFMVISESSDQSTCSHSYTTTTTKAATCTTNGIQVKACSKCGKIVTEEIKGGHNYISTTVDSTCNQIGYTRYNCSNCGDEYTVYDESVLSNWSTSKPTGVAENLILTKTQYRYADKEYITSANASESGYTMESKGWDKGTAGTHNYVKSWPSGFSTSNSLYSQYNVSPKSAYENESEKLVVNSDSVGGYLYYHWCYADSYYSVASQSGSYTTFHAYYDTTNPNSYTCDTSDMSYKTSSSNCSNSEWWFVAEVNAQKYTLHKPEYTHSKWGSWSAWSDTAITATDSRKVETQTVYRYANNLSDHNYVNGVCSVCGDTIAVATKDYYLIGYINGADYGCEADYQNMGQYKFVDGKLTATFTQNSYVFLKTTDNADWYMTQTYATGTSATFYNTNSGSCEKMLVPGGKELTFTLVENADGSLTLSYTTASTPVTPVTGSITLSGVTLSLEDEVLYNLYFTTSDMTVSAENMGLLVWDSEPTNATINGGATVIPGATVSGSTYMVQTNGIPGKNLGDTLYLVAYAQLDNGSYVYSKVLPYSAKTYCMSRLEKSSDANLKALCVALLNYGASAQEYFAATSDYTYTTLMNADLTAAQKGLVQAYNSSMMAPRGTVTAAKAGVFGTTNNGYSLRSASMSADGIFSINYYFTTANPATTVTMYYWTEADFNAVSTLTTANATGSKKMVATGTANQFWADIDGIAAKDLDKTVYVCGAYFYNGATYYTGVIPYSLGYYCSNKAENGGADIKPMAAATAVYSYYAKLYFNV